MKSELSAMKKCLPAFVTIEFPNEFLDWRRFDAVISLVGEITRSEYYSGRKYKFDFIIIEEHPVEPPLVEYVMPVFHPNISSYYGSVGLRMILLETFTTIHTHFGQFGLVKTLS